MINLRTRISQCLVDFGESRMFACQKVAKERIRKYGDLSWQWRWTFAQEGFWLNFMTRSFRHI